MSTSDTTSASPASASSNGGTAVPGTGARVHFIDTPQSPSLPQRPILATPPVRSAGDNRDIESCLAPAERERLIEEKRKFDSIRGLLLETINILFREYHVRGLKFFRRRVEDALSLDELQIASNMLMTLGRFHEVATPPVSAEDEQRE